MKLLLPLVMFVASVLAGAPFVAAKTTSHEDETPQPPEGDPDAERIGRLQEVLGSIVHGAVLGRTRVGVRVMDAASGRLFFRRRGQVLMDPASNQKVLATSTALLRLGADWRFRTELTGPAPASDGVIAGDVVLRGSGDPSLRAADLDALAATLADAGVQRIDGGVLADARRLGSDETAAGERSPLRVSRSSIVVRVRPDPHVGAKPSVTVRPLSEVSIVNRAVTRAKGRSRVSVALAIAGGRMVVTVSGRISVRHPGMVIRRMPPNPRLYTVGLLRAALLDAGIAVKDPAGLATVVTHPEPHPSVLLAAHESQPLALLIRRINKDSDNEYAERLLEATGAELFGGAATTAKGVRALREAMTELGLSASSYLPSNGSGLGHGNRVSADAMADLLRRLYLDPRFGPEILQSLSVGGVDGTTRNRFRNSSAAERVRAKTGTLNGKSCLSGFVGDGSDVVIFSILVEGVRSRRLTAVRSAQVSMVNAMMHYARGAASEPPVEEMETPGDLESGEDTQDSDEIETGETEHAAEPAVPAGVQEAAPP